MKVYDDKHIKNIVLLGATKSGKTTLAETMMFEAGILKRRGSVTEGNTVSDYHDIETQRGHSVYATNLHTEWRDYKINVIDTPGLDDFIGEVIAAVRIADTGVFVLNAQHGVEIGTELIWNYVDEYRKPIVFVVNQLDHDKADFDATVEQGRKRFGGAFTVMQYPVETGAGFNAIVDLLKMTMYKFGPNGGKPEKMPIPNHELERANRMHNELVEIAAANDEKLMELYFEKGNLDEDELREGLKIGMMKHEVFPVFAVSALKDMGSGRLMGFIDNVAPSAMDATPEKTTDGKELPCDKSKPTALFVYKSLVEPHLGNLSLFKVMSGEVSVGQELINSNGTAERIGQLFILDGQSRNAVNKLTAGDLGATVKLRHTFTNDTLHAKGFDVQVEPIKFPEPRLRVALVAKNKADEEKMGDVLKQIHMEDPTVTVEYSREARQVIVGAQGELHLAAM
ncbi:MAG TPA: GTP-binding protein, partial [Chitinophagales bacterium]|nr:GTP-binding protein [Chitinophagales bacterium]